MSDECCRERENKTSVGGMWSFLHLILHNLCYALMGLKMEARWQIFSSVTSWNSAPFFLPRITFLDESFLDEIFHQLVYFFPFNLSRQVWVRSDEMKPITLYFYVQCLLEQRCRSNKNQPIDSLSGDVIEFCCELCTIIQKGGGGGTCILSLAGKLGFWGLRSLLCHFLQLKAFLASHLALWNRFVCWCLSGKMINL